MVYLPVCIHSSHKNSLDRPCVRSLHWFHWLPFSMSTVPNTFGAWHCKGCTIHLDQCTYLQKVVEHCGMLRAKSASTPLPAGYYATKNMEPVDAELHSHFQMVIGSLLYLMLGTRPNIAFVVMHLSCHAMNPSQDHLNKVLYICHYLIGTSTYSLVYNGGSGAGLIACMDSDWGSDPTSHLSDRFLPSV